MFSSGWCSAKEKISGRAKNAVLYQVFSGNTQVAVFRLSVEAQFLSRYPKYLLNIHYLSRCLDGLSNIRYQDQAGRNVWSGVAWPNGIESNNSVFLESRQTLCTLF